MQSVFSGRSYIYSCKNNVLDNGLCIRMTVKNNAIR